MFDISAFEKTLATSWLGRSFFFFQELDSTNTYAKQMSRVDSLHGTLILADAQHKGRGQYERNWEATPGLNLTFSLVFEPHHQSRITILSLACALAVVNEFESISEQEFCLKWPNDILCSGKKVGGILTETIFNGNVLDRVIIGIGLNIGQIDFGDELSGFATSLALLDIDVPQREQILARLLSRMEHYFRLWSQRDTDLIRAINRRLIGHGKWVRLSINGSMKDGQVKFLGINEKGELMVLNKELEVDTFSYEQVRIHPD